MSTCVTCFRVRAWIVEDLSNKNDRYHLMKLNNHDLIADARFYFKFFSFDIKISTKFYVISLIYLLCTIVCTPICIWMCVLSCMHIHFWEKKIDYEKLILILECLRFFVEVNVWILFWESQKWLWMVLICLKFLIRIDFACEIYSNLKLD